MKKQTAYTNIYGEEATEKTSVIKKPRKRILPKIKLSGAKLGGAALMIFAFTAMVIAAPLTDYIKSSGEVTIVVATHDLAENTVISNDMVKEVQIQKTELLSQFALTLNDILGKYTSSFIGANEPLSFKRLSDAPTYRDKYLHELPEGKQAISVTLANMAASVSGKVQPNDIVSVLACPPNSDFENSAIQPLELQFVKVLDVVTTEGVSVAEGSEVLAPQLSTVTLLVNSRQAAILAYFDRQAPVHLALVCRGDDKKSDAKLQKQNEILEEIANNEETLAGEIEPKATSDSENTKESEEIK